MARGERAALRWLSTEVRRMRVLLDALVLQDKTGMHFIIPKVTEDLFKKNSGGKVREELGCKVHQERAAVASPDPKSKLDYVDADGALPYVCSASLIELGQKEGRTSTSRTTPSAFSREPGAPWRRTPASRQPGA